MVGISFPSLPPSHLAWAPTHIHSTASSLPLSPCFCQMLPGPSSCWRSCRSRVTSPATSSSPWRRSFRASSARPSERWVAVEGGNRRPVNASVTRGFFTLSPPRVSFLCFHDLSLARWAFRGALPINHRAPFGMFFPLKLLLMELPLSHLFSHICCVVHLKKKLNTFFFCARRVELESNMEVWSSSQSTWLSRGNCVQHKKDVKSDFTAPDHKNNHEVLKYWFVSVTQGFFSQTAAVISGLPKPLSEKTAGCVASMKRDVKREETNHLETVAVRHMSDPFLPRNQSSALSRPNRDTYQPVLLLLWCSQTVSIQF